MRTLLLFITSTVLLFGCNKEAQVNTKLKGNWKISYRITSWGNNSSSVPKSDGGVSELSIEFDNKGKGVASNSNHLVFDYIKDDKMTLTNATTGEVSSFHLKWGWNNKSFTLYSRGLNYGDSSDSYYLEVIYLFERVK